MLWFDAKRNVWIASTMGDPYPQKATEGQQLVNLESKDMKVLQLDGTWKLLGPFDVAAYNNSRFEEEVGAKATVEKPKAYKAGERIPSKEDTRTEVTPDPAYAKARKADGLEVAEVAAQPTKKVVAATKKVVAKAKSDVETEPAPNDLKW